MVLSAGINHVAMLTCDIDAFITFYTEVFDAVLVDDLDEGQLRHAFIDLGGGATLHPFQIPDNPHAAGSAAMFRRGHLDHFAINVDDPASFEELRRRLVARRATDGTVTDFGSLRTVSFCDPDGFEAEIALWQQHRLLRFDERIQEPYVTIGHD
jgi:catechol 2,3-dioxygenase-like lactoylglutathione lyase family enzyme